MVPIQEPSDPDVLKKVLWHFKHFQDDASICTISNRSRPPMGRVIRTMEGYPVDNARMNDIKSEARRQAKSLYKLTDGTRRDDDESEDGSPVKRWLQQHCREKWNGALDVLETKFQELRFCSGRWKADHLLVQSLRATRRSANDPKRQPTSTAVGKRKAHDIVDDASGMDSAEPRGAGQSRTCFFLVFAVSGGSSD